MIDTDVHKTNPVVSVWWFLVWAFDKTMDAMFYAAALIMVFLGLQVGYEVLMRYAFDRPTFWVLDASVFMIFYIGMLTAPRILKDDGHTRMTVVLDMLNPRLVQMINVVTNIGSAVITGVLTWRTGLDTWRSYFTFNAIYTRGFDVHQAIIWVIMPIGFGIMTLQFLRMGYRSLMNAREIRGEEQALSDRLAQARLASTELDF